LNTDFLIANTHHSLRPVRAGDEDFLYRVYGSTRTDEMALVDWSAEQKEPLWKPNPAKKKKD
jgi:hypothetical protein